jgi:putative NIF3 family GTP cyclohydrolase 1 type 2
MLREVTLRDVRAVLAILLGPPVPGDVRPVWRRRAGSGAPVRRVLLALEWHPEWASLCAAGDVWFLHRPFRLPRGSPLGAAAVFASHAAFDDRLSVGHSPSLAARLGLRADALTAVYRRPGDPLPVGMAADVLGPVAPASAWRDALAAEFGGLDAALLPDPAAPVRRIAAVGAMDAALVAWALAEGADLYVTGALRAPGREAAERAGLAVVAVGHRRAELWGLRHLARDLARALPGLTGGAVVLP